MLRITLALALVAGIISCQKNEAPAPASELDGIGVSNDEKNIAVILTWSDANLWLSNDASRLKGILNDEAFGGSWKVFHKEMASTDEALTWVKNASSHVSPNGTFFVYVAGHGSPMGTIGTQNNSADVSFPQVAAAIMEGRKNRPRLKRLIFGAFGCYSGNIVAGNNQVLDSIKYASADPKVREEQIQKRGSIGLYDQMLVFSATSANNYAYGGGHGSNLMNELESTFKALKQSKAEGKMPTIGQWIIGGTQGGGGLYRSFPNDDVMKDYLFDESIDSQAKMEMSFAGGDKYNMRVETKDRVTKLRICEGAKASCTIAKAPTMAYFDLDAENKPAKGKAYNLAVPESLKTNTAYTLVGYTEKGYHATIKTFFLNDKPTDSQNKNVITAASESTMLGEITIANDEDGDGQPDDVDHCFHTPEKKTVHKTGLYQGCSEGQLLD